MSSSLVILLLPSGSIHTWFFGFIRVAQPSWRIVPRKIKVLHGCDLAGPALQFWRIPSPVGGALVPLVCVAQRRPHRWKVTSILGSWVDAPILKVLWPPPGTAALLCRCSSRERERWRDPSLKELQPFRPCCWMSSHIFLRPGQSVSSSCGVFSA